METKDKSSSGEIGSLDAVKPNSPRCEEKLETADKSDIGESQETSDVSSTNVDDIDLIVGRSVKTRIRQKINEGAFGEIYIGELIDSGDSVAVKLELQSTAHPQLLSEGNIYRHLENGPGIPRVYWFGLHEPLYNVLVMDLLGPSLQDLFVYCGRNFTLKTTLLLVDQMLVILEYMHKKQYIHRDIKPDNFMIGRGDKANQVYIIDLGLTKKILPQRFSVGHIACSVSHPMVGTVRYASVHTHLGHDEGPRDDLESLGYVWAYFLRGSLPWQGISARTRQEKFSLICNLKKQTTHTTLFENLPNEFERYLDYVKGMRKDELANYHRVREVFRKIAAKRHVEYDFKFDWVIKQQETGEIVKTCDRTSHSGNSKSED